jgi:hypothetical protein
MVKQLESKETSATSQSALDPYGKHATTRSMTTTYTYNEKGYLDKVEGKGTEKGWEYSDEKSFNNPYTAALTVTYEIKLDKPREKDFATSKTYTSAGSNPVDPGTNPSNIDLASFTTSEALLSEAWEYYGASDMANATLLLDEVVRRHADEAAAQQAALTDFAPIDTASEYWALNDVGTAEYLLGCIDQGSENYSAAEQHFNTVISEYGFAQCWNPEGTGFFWQVADAAQEELISITENLQL